MMKLFKGWEFCRPPGTFGQGFVDFLETSRNRAPASTSNYATVNACDGLILL